MESTMQRRVPGPWTKKLYFALGSVFLVGSALIVGVPLAFVAINCSLLLLAWPIVAYLNKRRSPYLRVQISTVVATAAFLAGMYTPRIWDWLQSVR